MFKYMRRYAYMTLAAGLLLAMSLGPVAGADEVTEEAPAAGEVDETHTPAPEPTEAPMLTPEPTEQVLTPEPTDDAPVDTPQPTEAPTLTPEPTEQVLTPEPTATPTAEPPVIAPEPPLGLLYQADFTGDMAAWQTRPGWLLDASSALASGDAGPLLWLIPPLYDLAVEAYVQGQAGSAIISVRVNGPLSYSAKLAADGLVILTRAGQVVAAMAAPPLVIDQPHHLRISAFDNVIRVSVDGQPLITWVDDAPLPPGQVAFAALFPSPADSDPDAEPLTWAFHSPLLWLAADHPLLIPTPTPEVTPVPDTLPVAEADEDDTAFMGAQVMVSSLPAPDQVNPADGALLTTLRPRMTWRAVSGARLYRVDLAADPDFTMPLLTGHETGDTALTLTSRVLPAELLQGVYWWRVAARDADGLWSAPSPARSFTVGLPRAPRMDTFSTNASIPLTWTRALDASRYRLVVSSEPGFAAPLVWLETETNRVVRYAPPRGESWPLGLWFWRVDVEINSFWVESPVIYRFTVTPRPLNPPLLTAPANRVFTNNTSPALFWGAVADPLGQAVTYRVQIARQASFRTVMLETVTSDTHYALPYDLDEGIYYWRVAALNYLNAPSRWSRAHAFTVDTTPPVPPLLAAPRNGIHTAQATITLSWRAVRDAASYEVRWSTADMAAGEPPAGTPLVNTGRRASLRLTDPLLTRAYTWQVRAIDAAGNVGAWSAPFTFHVASPASAAPVLNRLPDAQPTLTWTRVSWAQGYAVQVATNNTFSSIVYEMDSIAANSLSHTLEEALPQGAYVWRVRARSGPDTWGAWSAPRTFLVALDE
jgi:hypothetical protein